MSKRFDALLFDAGGVFVVPDPLTTGMVLEPFGGTTKLGALVRCHYAGMAAIDEATASQAAVRLTRSHGSHIARHTRAKLACRQTKLTRLLRLCSRFSRRFCGGFHCTNLLRACGGCTCWA